MKKLIKRFLNPDGPITLMKLVDILDKFPKIKSFQQLLKVLSNLRTILFDALNHNEISLLDYDKQLSIINNVELEAYNGNIRKATSIASKYLLPFVLAPATPIMAGAAPAVSASVNAFTTAFPTATKVIGAGLGSYFGADVIDRRFIKDEHPIYGYGDNILDLYINPFLLDAMDASIVAGGISALPKAASNAADMAKQGLNWSNRKFPYVLKPKYNNRSFIRLVGNDAIADMKATGQMRTSEAIFDLLYEKLVDEVGEEAAEKIAFPNVFDFNTNAVYNGFDFAQRTFDRNMFYTGKPFYGPKRTNYIITEPRPITKQKELTKQGLEWIEDGHKGHSRLARAAAKEAGLNPDEAVGRIVDPVYNGDTNIIPLSEMGPFNLYEPVDLFGIKMPWYKRTRYNLEHSTIDSNIARTAQELSANSLLDKEVINSSLNDIENAYMKPLLIGDINEVLRLRNMHFAKKAPNPILDENELPLETYHTVGDNYDYTFTLFNPNIDGLHSGIFTSDNPVMSASYSLKITSKEELEGLIEAIRLRELHRYDNYIGNNAEEIKKNNNKIYSDKNKARKEILKKHPWINNINEGLQKKLYLNMDNPAVIDAKGTYWSNIPIENAPKDLRVYPITDRITDKGPVLTTRSVDMVLGGYPESMPKTLYDGAIFKNVYDYGPNKFVSFQYNGPHTVFDVQNPAHLKLADPITYFKADDPEVLSGLFKEGDVIPLSMRDDFSRNDIRFGWVPWLIPAGLGLGLSNTNK